MLEGKLYASTKTGKAQFYACAPRGVVKLKVGEEGRFHGGAQSIALRVEGFAQSDALRSAPTLNHTPHPADYTIPRNHASSRRAQFPR